MTRAAADDHPPGEVQRRKACIASDLGDKDTTLFKIDENPSADGSKPLIERAAESKVDKYAKEIDDATKAKGVDPDLLRALMYMETTHGWYDYPLDLIGKNKSILPMNINHSFWGDTFGTRPQLHEPAKNIMGGAEMVKRIIKCMPDNAPIDHIATIYNSLSARKVSNYGARVKEIYNSKPWKKK
jgi:hypothetical protein